MSRRFWRGASGPSRIDTFASIPSQPKPAPSKTNSEARGSRRSRRVRTRAAVPLLHTLPSTTATPTLAGLAKPSRPTVIIAAAGCSAMKARS